MIESIWPPARASRASPPGSASPVDNYLHALSRAVPGRGRAKRDVMREISNGLEDAKEALTARGLAREAAEREAVAQFGPVSVIARECSVELMALSARRLAIAFGIILPIVMASWQVIWITLPQPVVDVSRKQEPGWYSTLASAVDWFQLIMAAGAIVGAVWLSRGSLRQRRPDIVVTIICAWILLGIGLTAGGGEILSFASPTATHAGSPALAIGLLGGVSIAIAAVIFIVTIRSLFRMRRALRLPA